MNAGATQAAAGVGPPDWESEERIESNVRRMSENQEARRRFNGDHRPDIPSPADGFSDPDKGIEYLVDKIWPKDSRIVLNSQAKSGKTTIVANLIKALTTWPSDFLGFDAPTCSSVALIDTELDRRVHEQGWLLPLGVELDLVTRWYLRGQVAAFDILDPVRRAQWAARLRHEAVDVVILDCLGPVVRDLGLDENHEAGLVLSAFDSLLLEAGVRQGLVVHHMGHGAERARGDSRIRDWPDVEWTLTRRGDAHDAPRYFRTQGRTTYHLSDTRILMDDNRALTLGKQTAKVEATDEAMPALKALLASTPNLSGRKIEEALGSSFSRNVIRDTLTRAKDTHVVVVDKTANGYRYSLKEQS